MLNLSLRPIGVLLPACLTRHSYRLDASTSHYAISLRRGFSREPRHIPGSARPRDRAGDAAIFRGRAPLGVLRPAWRGGSRALAGACAARAGSRPGERVAIVMRNAPEYLEALYATWWAGLVAVPVNAKLHPREVALHRRALGRARWCSRADDWLPGSPRRSRAGPGAEVLEAGGAEYERLASGAGDDPCPRRRATSRGSSTPAAPPAGPRARCSRTRNLAQMTAATWRASIACRRDGPPAARGADVARLGPLHLHAPRAGRGPGGPGIGRLRRGRGARPPRGARATSRSSPRRRWCKRLAEAARARRCRVRRACRRWSTAAARCTSPTSARRWRRFGNRFAQIYGQGEIADDDHRAREGTTTPTRRTRATRSASPPSGVAQQRHRARDPRRAGPRPPAGRDRRGLRARRRR